MTTSASPTELLLILRMISDNMTAILIFMGFVIACCLYKKIIGEKLLGTREVKVSGRGVEVKFDEATSVPQQPQQLEVPKPDGSEATSDFKAELESEVQEASKTREQLMATVIHWGKNWLFENVSHFIYPGQVDLLKHLSTSPDSRDSSSNLFKRFFYDDFFRPFFVHPYTFPQYMSFLLSRHLIDISSPEDRNPIIIITPLGREFLQYIHNQNYGRLYMKTELSCDSPKLNVSGTWHGELIGDNAGEIEVLFSQHQKQIRAIAVLLDRAFGKIEYEIRGKLCGQSIRALVISAKPLEPREGLLHSPIGLIASESVTDKRINGIWTMSTGRSGDFVLERGRTPA